MIADSSLQCVSIAIERAPLADWIGHAAWWLAPLAAMIGAHVKTAPVIHADDTPVPLLSPGLGRTRTGRLWVYLADEQSWQGPHAPAAWYRFSPDRKGERPATTWRNSKAPSRPMPIPAMAR